MRNKIRCLFLAFLRDVKVAFTRCEHCGVFGADACSIARCKKLCGQCQVEVHNRLDAFFKSRDIVDTTIYGLYANTKK